MYLIVRDVKTGQPAKIPITTIPRELWPDTWYENPQWQYSRALVREEVAEFLNDGKAEISGDLARKLAQYIFDYAANIAVAVWLFKPDRQEYLEYMRPCLAHLALLKQTVRTRKAVLDMVHIALEYAIDPF